MASDGEGGIRTHDGFRRTRSPSERIRPLCYLSESDHSVARPY